ncbi:unnamed protein product [Rhizoctonia solani]|uniref:Uncharacterized protein n=1 Tax=Rhizoctonia solani TaxID=456999 RepID=A0A8H3HFB2_9AGAM|nr:unnamed protein product [Rhizoctonia solani]
MTSFPSTPFPITSYLSSPLWQLSPTASNSSAGWTPSCTESNCLPTASWSTSAVGSTATYMFWAWGHSIYGTVEGNMMLQIVRNGKEESVSPSGDVIYFSPGLPLDQYTHQNLTIKVLEASSGARLIINKAEINGSSFGDDILPKEEWKLASDNGAFQYTGFVQQAAPAGLDSPTTYVSTTAGDKMIMPQFNGSALTIYGPCGPSSGLMRVKVYEQDDVVNTTKPFQSDDCLLYQSPGFPVNRIHSLEVENIDGRTVAVTRVEFIRLITMENSHSVRNAGMIVGISVGSALLIAILILVYSTRSRKARQKFGNFWKLLCS